MSEAYETPMSDRIARFWQLLATEHVRILIDIRRDHDGYAEGGVKYHWDSASFSDDVAKALVAQRDTALALTHGAGEAIPLADHDEIGRKVSNLPWEIQQAIITIAAHCTALTDEFRYGKVADLAGGISQQCFELAAALAQAQEPGEARELTATEERLVSKALLDSGTQVDSGSPTAEDIYACAKSTLIGFRDELTEDQIKFICDQISRKAMLSHNEGDVR